MKNISLILVLIACFTACKNNAPSTEKIDAIEAKMKEVPNTGKLDEKTLDEAIEAYKSFAASDPKNEKSFAYMMKAGELLKNRMKFKDAIDLYDKIIADYPEHPKTPSALFMKGFILENDLKDVNTAKVIYEEFLSKYPQNELADDVKFSLDNLGKSPEEIIQMLQAKQKEDSTSKSASK